MVVRVPVIGNHTDGAENRKAVKELLKKYRPLKIELIKEHNLGENKYRSLGMKSSYVGVSDETMNQYKEELISLDLPTEICVI